MSNFAQYVFTLPKAQDPIILTLSLGWDKLKVNQRTITQVEMRRTLKVISTDKKVTIAASHPAYATIISLGQKSAEHIARFDEMAEHARQNKAGRKLIASIAALLKG